MPVEDATPGARPWRRNARRLAVALPGLLAWTLAMGAVGYVSSASEPIVDPTGQEFLFTLVLLVPLLLGVAVVQRQRRREEAEVIADAGRRRLLTDGAVLVGGGLVGAAAARPLLFATSEPAEASPMVTTAHGPLHGPKVLVTYESQYGSTGEIADRLGRVLARNGARVVVRHVDDVPSIAAYEQVIVGGAIQYDRWMPGASRFVKEHRGELASRSLSMFFVCLALSKEGGESEALGYERKIRAIAPELEPTSVQGFAGVLDYSRMSPVARLFGRVVLSLRGATAGDHRDWSAIDAWAAGIRV